MMVATVISSTGNPPENGVTKTRLRPPRKPNGELYKIPTPQHRSSLQITKRNTVSLDGIPEDEAVRKWSEHIKARRVSRRSQYLSDLEDDDKALVGTKVDEHHVNYEAMYNMLTGIRFVVSRVNAKLDRELTEADFVGCNKFSFDITGTELTPSTMYDFKFKDYAPWVFRHLRQSFGIDPGDYLMSLTSKLIVTELGSPGKSGSFFYFSRDYQYIIKTIHHAEHKFLRKILKQYYKHVEGNPNTLLSQFYGLHRVKLPYGRKIHFVVMNNLFPVGKDIHTTFDLKGSTIGRDYDERKLEQNPKGVMKDLNWLRRDLTLELGPTRKEAFVSQMERDVALLQRLGIMDYSLLVGTHDLRRGNKDNLREQTLHVFQPGADKSTDDQPGVLMRTPSKLEHARRVKELRESVKKERPAPIKHVMPEQAPKTGLFYQDDGGILARDDNDGAGDRIYYLGIIDCLTRWNTFKKVENFFKGLGDDETQISPIPPQRYGERFKNFITGIIRPQKTKQA